MTGDVDSTHLRLTLFAGVLGPPIVWVVRFGAAYVLVPWTCTADALLVLHALTLVALAATAALGWLAWRVRRRTPAPRAGQLAGRAGELADADGADPITRVGRVRFMALFGMLGSALFSLIMLAEGLANFFLDPCQTSGPLLP